MPSSEHAKHDSECGEYERYYQMKAGDVVLDLGANLGHFTRVASQKVGETGLVVAFEPHPQNYVALLRNIHDLDNVFPVNAGASDAWSFSRFFHHPLNCGGHSFFKGCDDHTPIGQIPAFDIGHFIKLFGLKPNFFKIDTEGSEFGIILSLSANGFLLSKYVAYEVHTSQDYWRIKYLFNRTHHVHPDSEMVGVCHAIPQ